MSSFWKKPSIKTLKKWLSVYFSGVCMGAADLVPGISGGTVAFILGIYEELLQSIGSFRLSNFMLLFKGNIRAFFERVPWKFLLALLLGIGTAFITLASWFTYLLHHEVYRVYLYAIFLGFVVGSVIFCYKKIKKVRLWLFIPFLIGVGTAYVLTDFELVKSKAKRVYDIPIHFSNFPFENRLKILAKEPRNYDIANGLLGDIDEAKLALLVAKKILVPDSEIIAHATTERLRVKDVIEIVSRPVFDIQIVLCGAIAISAMLLPGISGSYMLTVLGMYSVVLGALVDFVKGIQTGSFDPNAFQILYSMALGILLGAILFAKVINYCLARFYDATIAILIGFMIGALRAVWPFWRYTYELLPERLLDGPILRALEPILPGNTFESWLALGCCILASLAVVVVELVIVRLSRSKLLH